mgnify:FL=1|jgi:uncharacterized protein
MKIEFDTEKRDKTLQERGLDFADAVEVFNGATLTMEDNRRDYGEPRNITYGYLNGREVVIVWTQRETSKRIISMRKANEREQQKFIRHLG